MPRSGLAIIDENLCRAKLSPADRAAQTARLKAIYEELRPETRHGGDRRSDQVDNLSTRSFADETAEATGKDARTIRRDAERGEKVSEEALNLVRGTALDTEALAQPQQAQPGPNTAPLPRAESLARQPATRAASAVNAAF